MAMNVDDAIHKAVYANGGPKVIADRLGVSASVLRAKANPNDDSRGFYTGELVELMSLTGDHRPLEALADEFGYLLTSIPEEIDSTDRALVAMVSDALKGDSEEADIRRAVLQVKKTAGGEALLKKANRLQAYLSCLMGHLIEG